MIHNVFFFFILNTRNNTKIYALLCNNYLAITKYITEFCLFLDIKRDTNNIFLMCMMVMVNVVCKYLQFEKYDMKVNNISFFLFWSPKQVQTVHST